MTLRSLAWNAWLGARGDVLSHARTIQDWESYAPDRIRDAQTARLAEVLERANATVPYYRSAFAKAGIVSGKGIRVERFAEIPVLDKATLRARFRELTADGFERRRPYENSSSGSTGEPVRFIQDREYQDWNQAVATTFDRWIGYEAGMPQVRIWGSVRDVKEKNSTIKGRIGRWLRRETWLSSFRMSPEGIRRYVNVINRVRPRQIVGYVEGLNEVASRIENEGLTVHSPDSIVTSAETLYRSARERISRAFRAPVFNRYGCCEMGPIASETVSHEGLVVSAPTHLVEILRPDGQPVVPGEIGELVITLLTNFSMPLIRYRVGDLGTWEPGGLAARPQWPGLLEVFGRTSDVLIADDGSRVHSNSLLFIFDDMAFIGRFQIVQETTKTVVVSIVLAAPCPAPEAQYAKDLDRIVDGFRRALGPHCEVSFRFVEDISSGPSGKFRHVISKLAYG